MNVHLNMTPGELAVAIDTAAMKRRQRAMDRCAVLNSEIRRFCHYYPIPWRRINWCIRSIRRLGGRVDPYEYYKNGRRYVDSQDPHWPAETVTFGQIVHVESEVPRRPWWRIW